MEALIIYSLTIFVDTLYSARLRQAFVSRDVGAKNTLLEHVSLPETLIGLHLCGAFAPAFLGLLSYVCVPRGPSCVKFYPLMKRWADSSLSSYLFIAPFHDRGGPVLVDGDSLACAMTGEGLSWWVATPWLVP